LIALALHAAAWVLQRNAEVVVPAYLDPPARVAGYAEVMETIFEHAGNGPAPVPGGGGALR
jgi:hypothetical protein